MNDRIRMIYKVLNMYERKKGYLWLPGMTVYCNRWVKRPHIIKEYCPNCGARVKE